MLSSFRRLWRSVIGWFEGIPAGYEVTPMPAAKRPVVIPQGELDRLREEAAKVASLTARAQLAEETNAANIAQARTSLDEKGRRIAYLEADAAQYARDRETIERLTTELDAAKHNNQVLLAADRKLAVELRSVKRERDELRQGMRSIHAVIKAHELSLIEIGEPDTATVHITRKQWEPNPILPEEPEPASSVTFAPILDTTNCGEGG